MDIEVISETGKTTIKISTDEDDNTPVGRDNFKDCLERLPGILASVPLLLPFRPEVVE